MGEEIIIQDKRKRKVLVPTISEHTLIRMEVDYQLTISESRNILQTKFLNKPILLILI